MISMWDIRCEMSNVRWLTSEVKCHPDKGGVSRDNIK